MPTPKTSQKAKELSGTLYNNPHLGGKEEVNPIEWTGKRPRALPDRGVAYWQKLARMLKKMRVLKASDYEALHSLVISYIVRDSIWEEMQRVGVSSPAYLKLASGLKSSQSEIRAWSKLFGLTPVDRPSLTPDTEGTDEERAWNTVLRAG